MNNPGGYEHTLCWDCANATNPAVCPWVRGFEPVPGWEAEKTLKEEDSWSPFESYLVKCCPLFERDGIRGGMKRYKKRGGQK